MVTLRVKHTMCCRQRGMRNSGGGGSFFVGKLIHPPALPSGPRYDKKESQLATLMVGATGTGKTAAAVSVMDQLDKSKYLSTTINFSSATQAEVVQATIEKRLSSIFGLKRTKQTNK